jgi:filamentous hemagglutinin family protein
MEICGLLKLAALAGLMAAIANPASAQIVPDKTLPNNSTVTPSGNRFTIDGGTRAGGSLFHSFQEFSLPTGGEAFFNNAADIQNILTRVTGKNVSNIDGLIRANGAANLLLINPNGIVFGRNARLNIGGSFLASSASSIKLSDGSFYSAENTQAPPLLTVNVPVGLQLGANPGEIRVEGNGHGFTIKSIVFTPVDRSQANEGLQVASGKTLALVGGDVNLVGGVVRAPEGHVELGSASAGEVSLTPADLGWKLGYEGIQNFRDINLSQQAGVDASGLGRGSIEIVGRNVRVTDGSAGLIQNEGSEPAGNLTVNASELLEVMGTNPAATFPSILAGENIADGLGGKTNIYTRRLLLSDGGRITNRTFGTAAGGDVSVSASESVEVSGFASSNTVIFTSLAVLSVGAEAENAGNMTIDTKQLTVLNGASIASSTYVGQGGNLIINASEFVRVIGIIPRLLRPATVSSATTNDGDAGTVTINTSRVVVRDGGSINNLTLGQGSAGRLTINASDSVEVSGKGEGGGLPSAIQADAPIFPEILRQSLRAPARPSGDSGNLTINTPRLIISDTGRVSVGNEGTGLAGNMQLNAGSILLLDTEGAITAKTDSGEGGNINVTTDFLQLRRNSQISAEAGGIGNGGNINIHAKNIVALENSDITANAFEGNGGNIAITTQGIFGTEFRPQQTPQSDITASSQFGLSGNVSINTPDANPSSGLLSLPQNLFDPNQKVVSGCNPDQQGSSLTVTGREGIPADPTGVLQSPVVWRKLRMREVPTLTSRGEEVNVSPSKAVETANDKSLVEATGWVVNERGEVELVARVPNSSPWYRPPQCQDVSAKSPQGQDRPPPSPSLVGR